MSLIAEKPDQKPVFTEPVAVGSPGLTLLLDYIDAGVVDRDRDDRHPFEEFEVIRDARLGALRLPVADGGGGATLTELFETVIALGEVDPNVAHSVRNHFNFTESLLRQPQGADARWLDQVRAGRLFGTSTTELSRKSAGRRARDFETAICTPTSSSSAPPVPTVTPFAWSFRPAPRGCSSTRIGTESVSASPEAEPRDTRTSLSIEPTS
ncbi:hypothetical protein [Mycobacterium sp. 236(2023)]|uniref:hypothetical protein n=1 Tax=Mycobacterium sp. 236(2023) TaxID=3038163 RepID=UPI0024151F3F|nr:hypothetical protein [Mycobacterium sp. 236(2023)]MDG4667620.1 hypothetical protein [Mycobacterium sp. 236(2023)]